MYSVNGELDIYDYDRPFTWNSKTSALATAHTNSAGEFEFKDIKEGHYLLVIDGGRLHDAFDVEITSKTKATKSLLIDISPSHPDCSGGHEIEISSHN